MAAAVYDTDMYVNRELSLETAELIERELKRPETLGLEVLADDLILALGLVHTQLPPGDHVQPEAAGPHPLHLEGEFARRAVVLAAAVAGHDPGPGGLQQLAD